MVIEKLLLNIKGKASEKEADMEKSKVALKKQICD